MAAKNGQFLLGLVAICVLACSAGASQAVLNPSTTTVDDAGFGYPYNLNYGSESSMSGNCLLGYQNMFTMVPPTSAGQSIVIDSASLKLYASIDATVDVYRVITPWLSLTPAGQAQFNVGGTYRDMANQLKWTNDPGSSLCFGASDYSASDHAVGMTSPEYNGSAVFDVTPVVAGIFASGVNEGMMLYSTAYIRTQESGMAEELTINYHYTPEPATMSLLVLGGLGLLRRR